MRDNARIVRIGVADVARAASMHTRCSTYTLWRCYHRPMGDPRLYLHTLLGRPGSVHLAVRDTSSRFIAMAHLMPDGDHAEAALLVDDAWQNSGFGTQLLHRLGRDAISADLRELYGLVLSGDPRIPAVLRHAAVPVRCVQELGVTTVWARSRDIATAVRPRKP